MIAMETSPNFARMIPLTHPFEVGSILIWAVTLIGFSLLLILS